MKHVLPLIARTPSAVPAPPSDAVIERLRRLPLHTLDDIRRRFPSVRIELAERQRPLPLATAVDHVHVQDAMPVSR